MSAYHEDTKDRLILNLTRMTNDETLRWEEFSDGSYLGILWTGTIQSKFIIEPLHGTKTTIKVNVGTDKATNVRVTMQNGLQQLYDAIGRKKKIC